MTTYEDMNSTKPFMNRALDEPLGQNEKWSEFRASGLLWWINMILHTFGWAIVIVIEDDGVISNAYPERVKYRGFSETDNDDGYSKVARYLSKNSQIIEEEAGYDSIT